jgi:5'(3')-deoxyribonucleotidase
MKILYIDMDGVLVNFQTGIDKLTEQQRQEYLGKEDECPGIFGLMEPQPGAIDAFNELSQLFDTYILSTAPWKNDTAWTDKLNWVKKYLGKPAYKRLILSHNKHLNNGDFLVDDRLANGADKFTGEHLHFGTSQFPNWTSVVKYLKE